MAFPLMAGRLVGVPPPVDLVRILGDVTVNAWLNGPAARRYDQVTAGAHIMHHGLIRSMNPSGILLLDCTENAYGRWLSYIVHTQSCPSCPQCAHDKNATVPSIHSGLGQMCMLTIRNHVRVAHDVDVVGGRRAATDSECHGIVRVLACDDLDGGWVVCPRLPPLGIGIQQSLLVASTPGDWSLVNIT
jgi:hypothetical protein